MSECQTAWGDDVTLLKSGKPLKYRRCVVCDHYVRELSSRGWCSACEYEFKALNEKKKPETTA